MLSYAITLALACAPQDPLTSTIQLPDGQTVTGAMRTDINQDGRMDLALACYDENTKKRSLRVHLREKSRKAAFKSTPSQKPYEIIRDVVAFTYVDCHVTPGLELVLLTPELVVAVVPSEPKGMKQLARHTLVWPAANPAAVVPLPQSAVDFDGDGQTDLLLPKPDGWVVLFQDGGGKFERTQSIDLPPREDGITKAVRGRGISAEGNTVEMRMRSGRPTDVAGMLLRTATRTPRCKALDLDNDGRLDVAMYRNEQMHAARQTSKGKFATATQPLPLPPNRLKAIDPAFNVQWPDVNGDGIADLLLTTSAKRDDEIEVRVDLYLADKSGTWSDKPASRLRMQQLARPPQLMDVDGDGKDDLVCVTLRTSAMGNLTNPNAASFDAQLTMYRNDGKAFVTPSILSKQLPLTTDSQLSRALLLVRPGRRGRPGDVLMNTAGNLERRFLNLKGGTLTMHKADAKTPIGKDSKTLIVDEFGDDILILTGSEVRHVSFRR